jgi:hypothetical protein
MTQVHTAPFLLVRPAPRAIRRSALAVRLDERLDRCHRVFTFVLCSLVVLLAYEIQTANTLGIPFLHLP